MIPNAPTSLDFGLGETADMMRESVRSFADSQIIPLAAETDKNNEFPMQLWPQMGELGVLGITVEVPDYDARIRLVMAHLNRKVRAGVADGAATQGPQPHLDVLGGHG